MQDPAEPNTQNNLLQARFMSEKRPRKYPNVPKISEKLMDCAAYDKVNHVPARAEVSVRPGQIHLFVKTQFVVFIA